MVAKICCRCDSITQVILLQCFLYTDGDRLEIASSQSAICWITFGENEEIFFLLCQEIVTGAEEPSYICHAVFLCRHGATIAVSKHFLCNLLWSLVCKLLLSHFDE